MPLFTGDCNFQIVCHIINSISLLGEESNNAHLDTSFASIDPKNETASHWRDIPESENCT